MKEGVSIKKERSRVYIRMDSKLKKKFEKIAEENDITLNYLINNILKDYIKKLDP